MKILMILLLFGFNSYAQYRNDMPDVSSPKLTNDYQAPVYSTINLSNQYMSVGSPKILILIGRRLGSDSSEWQADTRETISTMNRAYQGSNSSKDTRDTYRMTENRKIMPVIVTPGMREFYQGFSAYMQSQNMPIVSYDSILRLAQRNNELSGNIDRSTDKREIEADAVLANVDILVEITSAGSITVLGKTINRVRVTVTRMDSFETVSQHLGQGPEYYKIIEQWVTNSDGYKKVQTVSLHHGDVGFQMAGELLSKALNTPFSKKSAAINTNDGYNNKSPKPKKKKRVLPPKT